jgi:hypothetical protein
MASLRASWKGIEGELRKRSEGELEGELEASLKGV